MLCRYLSQDLCLLLISIIFTLIVHFALGNVIYNSNAVAIELQTVARAARCVCAGQANKSVATQAKNAK